MTFDPKNDNHAIVEVVFGLGLSRPLQLAEIERIVSAHDQWRDWMPRVTRQDGITFNLGSVGGPAQQVAFPSSGALFDRMLPDGSLQWRLRVDGTNIFVNCLEYTRWADVWPRVRNLLEQVLELLVSEQEIAVKQLVLQYIDAFEWTVDADSYDVSLLLKAGEIIPENTLRLGPWWHLHQGWFRNDQQLPGGRLLERLNIDATLDDKRRPTVKFDSYLAFDLPQPAAAAGKPLVANGELDAWFGVLHNLDKDLLRSCLTPDVTKRIKLDG